MSRCLSVVCVMFTLTSDSDLIFQQRFFKAAVWDDLPSEAWNQTTHYTHLQNRVTYHTHTQLCMKNSYMEIRYR